jgi:hypothetical protein
MEDEEGIRYAYGLSGSSMEVAKGGPFTFGTIDFFVAMSRDNTSVERVELFPFDSDAGNYEFWDKVGQIVGNLTELQIININFTPYNDGYTSEVDEDADASPDWETLTRILRSLRHKVILCSDVDEYGDDYGEEIEGLARVIHGHPMISECRLEVDLTFTNLGPVCSALAALPSLQRGTFSLRAPETEDQRVLVNPEPLMELLRAPALRFIKFQGFSATNALCHAMANALEAGSSVTNLVFLPSCTSFPDGGTAIIANALKRNTSVTNVAFLNYFDEAICNTLAAVLLCNSTLQNLTLVIPEAVDDDDDANAAGTGGRWLSSIFLSLAVNTTLKSLTAIISDEFGDELCAAISSGLAKNSTLEELRLCDMIPDGDEDEGAVSARNALSFLRTNSTLKSLTVTFVVAPIFFVEVGKVSYYSAFLLEAVKMLENTFLQSLTIKSSWNIVFEEFLALISALQLNTTLKALNLGQSNAFDRIFFTVDQASQLVWILMKNYGLEFLEPDIPCEDDGAVKAILRLNRAGRRYLIEDGSSISKGVEVLSAVNDDINCVFLHLLENPGLCDIRAVDSTTGRRRPGGNLDKSSSTGKRERVQSQPSQESRRRLA